MSEYKSEEVDYDVDPELVDDPEEGTGNESLYEEVTVEYDSSQFEFPEDFDEPEDGTEQPEGLLTASRTRFTGLPRHLRNWGLRVRVEDGWQYRGRPYTFAPRAVIVHHTASGRHSGNLSSLGIVRDGRSGLPGPLSQFLLGRDGTVVLVAGGYSNHAGTGGPRNGVPANLGNTYAWGIEAENDGLGEPWSKAQLNAYYRLCASLLDLMNTKDVRKVFAHKEWTNRKIDPAGINMTNFRNQVKAALSDGESRPTVHLSRLQPGKRNIDVVKLKRRLKVKGFYTADNLSGYFGSALLNAYARYQKSLGYSGKDANGVPGRVTLEKLDFKVLP